MSTPTIVSVRAKDGSKYDVTSNGATAIEVPYQVVLSAPLGPDELITSFTDGTNSVPAIGDEHPMRDGYYVSKYSVSQPKGAAKNTLDITVYYEATGATADQIEPEDPEEDPETLDSQVIEWGWDDGTSERELATSVDGKTVLNSAGDPFDSVPTVTTPAPTFTKVVKMGARQNYAPFFCTTNSAQMTIGAMTCPAHTLLCTIAEKRNIGDATWPFTYTIRLKFRSNIIKVGDSAQEVELGWDVGIVDAGMREIDDSTGLLKLIQVQSKESGQLATVTAPELLDGRGHKVSRGPQQTPTPTILQFQAYKRAAWPVWFTSEPGNNVPANANANA